MPPPSPLAIATGVVTRLVKEETSYHHELEQQQTSIAKLEAGEGAADENAEYVLRQQRKALEETKAIFPQQKQKIQDALAKLEQQLAQANGSSPEEIAKANEAAAAAQKAIQESS